jgi:hypothetical protein
MGVLPIACSCGLDPATETMAVQTGVAVVLSAPFWFRSQLTQAFHWTRRRLLSDPEGGNEGGEDGGGESPPA